MAKKIGRSDGIILAIFAGIPAVSAIVMIIAVTESGAASRAASRRIDQQFARAEADYDRINVGQGMKQVHDVLGDPDTASQNTLPNMDGGDEHLDTYGWRRQNMYITVTFTDYRVSMKSKTVV